MARERKEDPPKGAPAWQSTFSDLMNLLLCFFVLLFSMSTVDAKKMELVIQSFQQTFSVLPAGGSSINVTDGSLISSGVSALKEFDVYFNESTATKGDEPNSGKENEGTEGNGETPLDNHDPSKADDTKSNENQNTDSSAQLSEEELAKEYQEQSLSQSEEMAEEIQKKINELNLQDIVNVDFNGQYVGITLNGAVLFNSGRSEVMDEAKPLLNNIAKILNPYSDNLIQIEGHTDSVPIHSSKYESNDVLSMYRALNVADYIRSQSSIEPSHIVSAGRGEYDPIADNTTAEGRALNRRVEIKIFNDLNSAGIQD